MLRHPSAVAASDDYNYRSPVDKPMRIGNHTLFGSPVSSGAYWGFATLAGLALLAALVVAATSLGMVAALGPDVVKHVNGVVNPTGNNVNLVVRTDVNGGLAVDNNILANGAAGVSSIALRNLGVLTLGVDRGLANTGTAQDPVLTNTMDAGTGISIAGTNAVPLIQNEGVLSVSVDRGLANTGTAQDPVLTNTMDAGTGISIAGTNAVPLIQNEGVLGVTSAGTGITVGGTLQNPTIQNDGVLDVTAGTAVELTGTAQQPVVHGKLSRQARTLLESDPINPVCVFEMTPFDSVSLPSDSWTAVPFATYAIGSGQGQNGTTSWNVPFTGVYQVHVTCTAQVSFDTVTSRVGLNLALSLRAASVDPASGLVPAGGQTRSDVSYVNDAVLPTTAPTVAPTTVAPTTVAPSASPTTAAPTTEAPTAPPSPPTDAPTAAPTTEAPTEAPTTVAPTQAPTTRAPTTEAPSARRRTKSRGVVMPVPLSNHVQSLTASFRVCNGCAHPTSGQVGDQLQLHAKLDTSDGSTDSASIYCTLQTVRVL